MNESHLKNVIEAALLAAGRPLHLNELAELFEESGRPAAAQLREALTILGAEYETRGIELKETAGGFRVQVRQALAGDTASRSPAICPRSQGSLAPARCCLPATAAGRSIRLP